MDATELMFGDGTGHAVGGACDPIVVDTISCERQDVLLVFPFLGHFSFITQSTNMLSWVSCFASVTCWLSPISPCHLLVIISISHLYIYS